MTVNHRPTDLPFARGRPGIIFETASNIWRTIDASRCKSRQSPFDDGDSFVRRPVAKESLAIVEAMIRRELVQMPFNMPKRRLTATRTGNSKRRNAVARIPDCLAVTAFAGVLHEAESLAMLVLAHRTPAFLRSASQIRMCRQNSTRSPDRYAPQALVACQSAMARVMAEVMSISAINRHVEAALDARSGIPPARRVCPSAELLFVLADREAPNLRRTVAAIDADVA